MWRFADAYPGSPWKPGTDEMVAWLADQHWAAETRKSHRTALRSFYGWAWQTGWVSDDPSIWLPPVKLGKPQARPTPEQVLADALQTARADVRVMIVLGARFGLRRGEIALLHAGDICEAVDGHQLLVHGKGGKQRMIPIAGELASELRVRAAGGWVFPGRVDGHVSPQHVGVLVSGAMAGTGWTAHSLRHRFASQAYLGSRDLLSVQTLLGHSSPETTRRYVQLPQDALRAAMSWAA